MASAAIKSMKASVILFPGQGSQFVGMAMKPCTKGLSLFEIAGQVLGYDLLQLCQNGPADELNRTVHSQPAVFVSSLSAVERLAEMSRGAIEDCVATAGFSVGEFAALVFAQSISFVDALKLVQLRAEITQVLSDSIPGGMMTALYSNDGNINQACKLAREYCVRSGLPVEESVCQVANHLFPHGKVIGGHQKALEFLKLNGKNFGIKSMKSLAVSGAFHTGLMRPAANDLKKALNKLEIKKPKIRVYSNVDATCYEDVEQIRSSLVKHVYKPVLWEQVMQKLYADVRSEDELPITFECGPQRNLVTMLGMINLKAKKLAFNIGP